MSRGNITLLEQFFSNPRLEKPLDQIYEDLQGFSYEYLWGDETPEEDQFAWVILPPLWYEGRFVKGILFTQGAEYLLRMFPQFGEYFFIVGESGSCNYPWTPMADGYMAIYDNPHREAWFRKTHPEKQDKVLVPLEGSDFYLNEYVFAPPLHVQKDIDVLMVARILPVKNIPLVAEAIKLYNQKYGSLKMLLLAGQNWEGPGLNGLHPYFRGILEGLEEQLGNPWDYIELQQRVPASQVVPYYTRAKVVVLGSLIEGKNRSLREAMFCNTPVVCFRAFNQYIRGPHEAIPEGAGLYAEEFTAECLADTLHHVLQNLGDFTPRKSALRCEGLRHSFNKLLDRFSFYYQTVIPDFEPGRHTENLWLDLAIQANHQKSLMSYLYEEKHAIISNGFGPTYIQKLFDYVVTQRIPPHL